MWIWLTILFFSPIGIVSYVIYVGIFRRWRAFRPLSFDNDHSVILKMHRDAVAEKFRTKAELEYFIRRLQWEMGNVGEVSQIEFVDDTATIIIMGENAEEVYAKIRKVLRHASIAKNAAVILRYGPPGSRERRTHMAN